MNDLQGCCLCFVFEVASLGCHYKSLMHLSSLYDDLKPWLDTLAEYRRSKPDHTKHRRLTKPHTFTSQQQQGIMGSSLLRNSGSFSATLVDSIRSFISSGKGSYEATKRSMRISQEMQFLLPSVRTIDNQMPHMTGPCDGVVPVVEITVRWPCLSLLCFSSRSCIVPSLMRCPPSLRYSAYVCFPSSR